jgi:hypothetical protein
MDKWFKSLPEKTQGHVIFWGTFVVCLIAATVMHLMLAAEIGAPHIYLPGVAVISLYLCFGGALFNWAACDTPKELPMPSRGWHFLLWWFGLSLPMYGVLLLKGVRITLQDIFGISLTWLLVCLVGVAFGMMRVERIQARIKREG